VFMLTMQCNTLLELCCSGTDGKVTAQCHSEPVTKMSSQCSVAVAFQFHFIQSCELYKGPVSCEREHCVCIDSDGDKGVAIPCMSTQKQEHSESEESADAVNSVIIIKE